MIKFDVKNKFPVLSHKSAERFGMGYFKQHQLFSNNNGIGIIGRGVFSQVFLVNSLYL